MMHSVSILNTVIGLKTFLAAEYLIKLSFNLSKLPENGHNYGLLVKQIHTLKACGVVEV